MIDFPELTPVPPLTPDLENITFTVKGYDAAGKEVSNLSYNGAELKKEQEARRENFRSIPLALIDCIVNANIQGSGKVIEFKLYHEEKLIYTGNDPLYFYDQMMYELSRIEEKLQKN